MNANLELALGGWKFRSVWISDVHLGTKHSQVDLLLDFLRECDCRYLYIVGDLFDGWELKAKWFWRDEYNVLIQKLLRKSRKQTRVIYLSGNHDEFVEEFLGLRFGSVTLARQVIHIGADGQRYLVLHGHQADGLVHFNRLLDRVGSRLYQWILDFNVCFNRVRRRLGFGYWSVSRYLKGKAKAALRYVADHEEILTNMARKQNVQGVICGHIHRAEIKTVNGLRYLNCGDWVESCTALVEDYDGNMRLLDFHENLVLYSRRGSRAYDAGNGREGDAGNEGAHDRGAGRRYGTRARTAGILHIGHADARHRAADAAVCLQRQ